MSEFSFTRRSFLQAAGVTAAAVALTACSGDDSNDPNAKVLGNSFRVSVLSVVGQKSEKIGSGDGTATYKLVPTIKISYIGSGKVSDSFKNVFAVTANGVAMKLSKGGNVSGSDNILLNGSSVYQPEFTTSDAAAQAAFENGGEIKLKITLLGDTATYTIKLSGKTFTVSLDK